MTRVKKCSILENTFLIGPFLSIFCLSVLFGQKSLVNDLKFHFAINLIIFLFIFLFNSHSVPYLLEKKGLCTKYFYNNLLFYI